jgi:hypothetical protein
MNGDVRLLMHGHAGNDVLRSLEAVTKTKDQHNAAFKLGVMDKTPRFPPTTSAGNPSPFPLSTVDRPSSHPSYHLATLSCC